MHFIQIPLIHVLDRLSVGCRLTQAFTHMYFNNGPMILFNFFFQLIFTFNIPSVRNVVAAIGWEILLSYQRERKDNKTMFEGL